jgi:hypothetical protein
MKPGLGVVCVGLQPMRRAPARPAFCPPGRLPPRPLRRLCIRGTAMRARRVVPGQSPVPGAAPLGAAMALLIGVGRATAASLRARPCPPLQPPRRPAGGPSRWCGVPLPATGSWWAG